jgi:hypothetical protein
MTFLGFSEDTIGANPYYENISSFFSDLLQNLSQENIFIYAQIIQAYFHDYICQKNCIFTTCAYNITVMLLKISKLFVMINYLQRL